MFNNEELFEILINYYLLSVRPNLVSEIIRFAYRDIFPVADWGLSGRGFSRLTTRMPTRNSLVNLALLRRQGGGFAFLSCLFLHRGIRRKAAAGRAPVKSHLIPLARGQVAATASVAEDESRTTRPQRAKLASTVWNAFRRRAHRSSSRIQRAVIYRFHVRAMMTISPRGRSIPTWRTIKRPSTAKTLLANSRCKSGARLRFPAARRSYRGNDTCTSSIMIKKVLYAFRQQILRWAKIYLDTVELHRDPERSVPCTRTR